MHASGNNGNNGNKSAAAYAWREIVTAFRGSGNKAVTFQLLANNGVRAIVTDVTVVTALEGTAVTSAARMLPLPKRGGNISRRLCVHGREEV